MVRHGEADRLTEAQPPGELVVRSRWWRKRRSLGGASGGSGILHPDLEDALHVTTAVPPGTLSPEVEVVDPTVDPPVPASSVRRSFRANSTARFLSDGYLLLTSITAATITARVLGPSGKGFYSTLTLLSVLLVQLFNLGLGEASVVLVGRGRAAIETATSATIMALVPLSAAGALSFFVIGSMVLGPETSNERTAILMGTLLVLFNVWATGTVWFLVLQERIVLVAGLTALGATFTTAALWYLVAEGDYGAAGAVAGGLLGCVVVLAAVIGFVLKAKMPLRPRWNTGYLRPAVRFGAAVQMSNLLVQMTGRLDLVLVYRLSDSAAAGTYSIALTIGALVGAVPIALAFASFPRLAQLEDVEADAFTLQLFRMGIVAAIGSAALLAVLTPFVLPLVFGRQYVGSITPTVLLVVGGVFWSGQWILSRATAARGRPKAVFVSFALSFVVMLALDLLLIGRFEGTGAAVASVAGSVVGFVVAATFYRGWDWRGFVPRWADCTYVVVSGHEMVSGLVKRRRSVA